MYTVNPDGGGEQLVDIPEINEDWGRAVWSHDGQQLLLSNILRFDQQGELLPFRPATARPDGSEFNLLELPDFSFDMLCMRGVPTTRRSVWRRCRIRTFRDVEPCRLRRERPRAAHDKPRRLAGQSGRLFT